MWSFKVDKNVFSYSTELRTLRGIGRISLHPQGFVVYVAPRWIQNNDHWHCVNKITSINALQWARSVSGKITEQFFFLGTKSTLLSELDTDRRFRKLGLLQKPLFLKVLHFFFSSTHFFGLFAYRKLMLEVVSMQIFFRVMFIWYIRSCISFSFTLV